MCCFTKERRLGETRRSERRELPVKTMSAEIIYALICGTATTIIVFEFVILAVLVLIIVDYKIIFVAMLGPFFVLSTYFGSRYVIKLIGLEGFVPSDDWPQYAVTLIEIMLIIVLF